MPSDSEEECGTGQQDVGFKDFALEEPDNAPLHERQPVHRGYHPKLNSACQKHDDQNEDDEAGTAAQIVVARVKSVTTASEQQNDENNDEDVHDV